MSAGMAGIISGVLSKHRKYVRNEDAGGVICGECGWEVASKRPDAHPTKSTIDLANIHEAHAVLTALARAGYGNVQEALLAAADEMPIETLAGADNASIWLRQRAHALDKEGRTLVHAIHDRKAEASRATTRGMPSD